MFPEALRQDIGDGIPLGVPVVMRRVAPLLIEAVRRASSATQTVVDAGEDDEDACEAAIVLDEACFIQSDFRTVQFPYSNPFMPYTFIPHIVQPYAFHLLGGLAAASLHVAPYTLYRIRRRLINL